MNSPVSSEAALPSESQFPTEERKTNSRYIEIKNYNFFYGSKQALHNVNLAIPEKSITSFIGPSGCGKSTLLRNLNRMNDLVGGARHGGDILVNNVSIYAPNIEVISLRKRIGMVFQKSNPFADTIYENVIFSLRIAGQTNRRHLDDTVERSLRGAALWDEVKDRLHTSALGLSGGQQQRLCIARAVANHPEILLMDEPCSALDPIATMKVEELLVELRRDFTIVIVTHNMQQAGRCSDNAVFMFMGKVIESGKTVDMFSRPKEALTEDYITGRMG